jgi:hypothetical protein
MLNPAALSVRANTDTDRPSNQRESAGHVWEIYEEPTADPAETERPSCTPEVIVIRRSGYWTQPVASSNEKGVAERPSLSKGEAEDFGASIEELDRNAPIADWFGLTD